MDLFIEMNVLSLRRSLARSKDSIVTPAASVWARSLLIVKTKRKLRRLGRKIRQKSLKSKKNRSNLIKLIV